MRTDPPISGGSTPATADTPTDPVAESAAAVYQRIHDSAEFQGVRRHYRNFAFPAVVGVLVWYMLYVVLSVTAPGFMGVRLFGEINVGFVFTVLQVLTTIVVSHQYSRHAAAKRDSAALRLRWKAQEELR
ncbi:DUF485 domain-containing protein [Actinacidiphila oryziradicis]|uniref:DUF485 domain-containing protein n=1 Tax=Actinacidiphila oryziradicis TaxID=2571141 RepID=UPI0023EF7BDE|nr:DUF485 domain-containing protein [Actinacidiphila oryziradicis]MCW2874736.1 hypothetical protein [Actinacidiphila oryziradicis]